MKKTKESVSTVIDNLRKGRKLCKFLRQKTNGFTEVIYAYEPGGKMIDIKTAELAIREGRVIPCGDGLFGDNTSQTWVLPPEAEQATLFEGAAAPEPLPSQISEVHAASLAGMSKAEAMKDISESLSNEAAA